MKFDKETVVVIAIAVAILIGWSFFYPKYQEKKQAEQARTEQARLANELARKAQLEKLQAERMLTDGTARKDAASAQTKPEASAAAKNASAQTKPEASAAAKNASAQTKPEASAAAKNVSAQTKPEASAAAVSSYPVLENDRIEYTFEDRTGEIVSATLKNYRREIGSDELFCFRQEGKARRTFDAGDFSAAAKNASVKKQSDQSGSVLEITREIPDFRITERFFLAPGTYELDVSYTVVNTSGADKLLPEVIFWTAGLAPQKFLSQDKVNTQRQNVDYCLAEKRKVKSVEPKPGDLDDLKKESTSNRVSWAGSTNKYFASLLFPDEPFDAGVRIEPAVDEKAGEKFVIPSVGGVLKNVSLPANAAKTWHFRYYFGPKELKQIEKLPETAMEAMHIAYWSWFEFLARPLARFLVWLNGWIGNYGISIIILTLLVRLVLWPFQQKANTSMRKMQKLQPQLKALREKYKENPQELNMRMMELYRTEGVNPLGGCLPMLLQLPIFFALYSVFDSAVELRHVSFLWAKDLAQPDQVGPVIELLGFQLAIHPWILLMTALMIVQQKMTPQQGDPMQQKIMMAMPVIMLVFLYNLPSGLTLYWTVSQIFSIAQMKYSLYIAKRDEGKDAPAPKSKSA